MSETNTDLLIIVMPVVVALIAGIVVLWRRRNGKKIRVFDLTSQSTGDTSIAFWVSKFDELEAKLDDVLKLLREQK